MTSTSDPVADIARATAGHLVTDRAPRLAEDVEIALLARDGSQRADTYFVDPVSLGSSIVAIATLAWTVYSDLQNRTSKPADAEVLARTIRVRLRADGGADGPDRNDIIDIVVEETIRAGAPKIG